MGSDLRLSSVTRYYHRKGDVVNVWSNGNHNWHHTPGEGSVVSATGTIVADEIPGEDVVLVQSEAKDQAEWVHVLNISMTDLKEVEQEISWPVKPRAPETSGPLDITGSLEALSQRAVVRPNDEKVYRTMAANSILVV